MASSAFTIKAFGVYAALAGLGLLVAPDLALAPVGIAPPREVWVRVLGALAVVIGYYYWTCGAADAKVFFKASVAGRLGFAALCLALIALAGAPAGLLAFALIDVLGAAWTAAALRREAKA